MAPQPDIARIIEAYGGQYDRLQAELDRRTGLIWRELGGASASDRNAWLAQIVPLVKAAEAQAFNLFSGYVNLLGPILGLSRIRRERRPDDLSGRGVDPREVMERPIVTLRRLLGEGRPPAEAMRVAGQRAIVTVNTNVVAAHRNAADIGMKQLRVTGYRRVLTGKSCERCIGASQTVYRTGDLMPIHTHCDCRVAPVFGTADPGDRINSLVASNLGSPVEIHGELGPVLTDSSHNFARPGGE